MRFLCVWADLETSGRLEQLNETQLQGDFLAQVFGQALEYVQPIANAESWHQEQHRADEGQTPDAVLGQFTQQNRLTVAVVELNGPTVPEAVEITQLALWIRSATPGQTLATLSRNIVHGNSLVHDQQVHALGFDWHERFPEVFDRAESGFDCVIGNPPWERMDLSEREFFSLPAPEIATSTTGAKRQTLVDALEEENPSLYAKYIATKSSIDSQREYCQESGE